MNTMPVFKPSKLMQIMFLINSIWMTHQARLFSQISIVSSQEKIWVFYFNYILKFNLIYFIFFQIILDNVHGNMCYIMLPSIYGIAKISAVMGLAFLIGNLFLFCTAMRYYKDQKWYKIKNPDEGRGNVYELQ